MHCAIASGKGGGDQKGYGHKHAQLGLIGWIVSSRSVKKSNYEEEGRVGGIRKGMDKIGHKHAQGLVVWVVSSRS